ncbi:FAD:protein FMN transferase [Endothiovibrio diazotrophicus]
MLIHTFNAMGCANEVQLHAAGDERAARAAAEAADAEVRRLERRYSRYRDDSVVAAINRAAGGAAVELDEESAALIDYAAVCFAESGGLFDVTSGVLRRAWNFRSGRLPAPSAVEALRPLVGWGEVEWQRPWLRLPRPGMEIDLGGVVKEYAADRAAAVCRGLGIEHGLINLGGDLHALGPRPDGTPWAVGIRHPRRPDGCIASVALRRGGLASSGDYERYLEVDGRRYSHLLDPATGWPVERPMQAVTVLADACLIAGSASTIALLKGNDAGRTFLDDLGLPHLRVTADGRLEGPLAG